MALTTLYLRHQLRRTLSHLTTTTTKHLIPYSSPQRLTNTNTVTTVATYRNFHLTHFPRSFSSASRSVNDIDKIDPDTILFEGCDYKHWLIVMHFGRDKREYPPADQMVETYVQTAAKVVGSVEEAKRKIYACSTTTYTGFQLEVDEETSKKFEGLPGVIFVLPDSYIDPVNKEYGGDKFINGEIIHRPAPVQYGRTKRPDRSNDTRERFPMSNQQRNPAYNQQGNPPYNQPRNPPYNQQANPPYNQQANLPYNQQANPPYNQRGNPPNNRQGNPAYNQQQNSPYNQQGYPAYNQQESTRGYGRGYTTQGPQQNGFQQQPPQQNYPQNQNMGSFNPIPNSNSIPNPMPPSQQGNYNYGYNQSQGQMNNHPGDQGSFVPPGQEGNYPGHYGQGAGGGYSQSGDANYPPHGGNQMGTPPSNVQFDPQEQGNYQPGGQTGFNQGRN